MPVHRMARGVRGNHLQRKVVRTDVLERIPRGLMSRMRKVEDKPDLGHVLKKLLTPLCEMSTGRRKSSSVDALHFIGESHKRMPRPFSFNKSLTVASSGG